MFENATPGFGRDEDACRFETALAVASLHTFSAPKERLFFKLHAANKLGHLCTTASHNTTTTCCRVHTMNRLVLLNAFTDCAAGGPFKSK